MLRIDDLTEGVLRVADFSYERIDDLSNVISVGDSIEVKVLGVDRKVHQLQFSHKILEQVKEEAKQATSDSSNTTLGDLLKEHMNKDES